MLNDIDAVATNRFADALLIQQGASNPTGIARTLLRAINACHREQASSADDPAVRLIAHQLAHVCGVQEIEHSLDTYGQLANQCETRSAGVRTSR